MDAAQCRFAPGPFFKSPFIKGGENLTAQESYDKV